MNGDRLPGLITPGLNQTGRNRDRRPMSRSMIRIGQIPGLVPIRNQLNRLTGTLLNRRVRRIRGAHHRPSQQFQRAVGPQVPVMFRITSGRQLAQRCAVVCRSGSRRSCSLPGSTHSWQLVTERLPKKHPGRHVCSPWLRLAWQHSSGSHCSAQVALARSPHRSDLVNGVCGHAGSYSNPAITFQ
jgi:hypothetical protein